MGVGEKRPYIIYAWVGNNEGWFLVTGTRAIFLLETSIMLSQELF
jgi:hypothetical protein